LGIKVVPFARLADEDLLLVVGKRTKTANSNCEISAGICYGETGLEFISRNL